MQELPARCGLVLLILCLVNCGTWHATQAPLSELVGKHVRVTAKDGKRQEGKLVDADSLGLAVLRLDPTRQNRYRAFAVPNVLAIDTPSIARVDKRVFSPGRTVGLVVIPAALVFSIVVVVVFATAPWAD